MNLRQAWEQALPYDAFLAQNGTPVHAQRWQQVWQQTHLTPAQSELLRSFRREMQIFCLAGAWCGDCVDQCPILHRFAQETDCINLRFFDRDADAEVREALSICGGARVPVVVISSEDGREVCRYGDRTLAKYRRLAQSLQGASCSTGLQAPPLDLHQAVIQEWLDLVERAQLLLRVSPRLREIHGD